MTDLLSSLAAIIGVATAGYAVLSTYFRAREAAKSAKSAAQALVNNAVENLKSQEIFLSYNRTLEEILDPLNIDHTEYLNRLKDIERALKEADIQRIKESIEKYNNSKKSEIDQINFVKTVADIQRATKLIKELIETGLAEKIANVK